LLFVCSDFNAKVGEWNLDSDIMGQFGLGERNEASAEKSTYSLPTQSFNIIKDDVTHGYRQEIEGCIEVELSNNQL